MKNTQTGKSPLPKNLALWDRALRAVAAIVIGLLWFFDVLTGWTGIALMVLAGGLLLNSVVGVCGLYAALGISTCPRPKPQA